MARVAEYYVEGEGMEWGGSGRVDGVGVGIEWDRGGSSRVSGREREEVDV